MSHPLPTLVGLSGYARSGKDTAAQALIELGYERRAFADKLKDLTAYLDPIVAGYIVPGCDCCGGDEIVFERLSEDLAHGWESAKRTPEVRELLQRLGVGAREILGDSVWVDAALDGLPDSTKLVVVTDVRFPNEANAIRAIGGVVYRVERAGVVAVNGHISETALDGYSFDGIIENNGTIEQLHATVRAFASAGAGV